MLFWTRINTPIGLCTLIEEDGKLARIRLGDSGLTTESVQQELEQIDSDTYCQDTPLLDLVESQIQSYFEGSLTTFDVSLTMDGTAFQQQVWGVIASISYGQSLTYGEIARKIGRPKAARAIGGACGRNPIPIVIPCHRVLASDGYLGGYSSGLENKQYLLNLENVSFKL